MIFGQLLSPSGKHSAAVILALIIASIYATTMNPTVSFIDSGELASVASTLGIAHPTGYPFFTVLGRLALMISPAADVIFELNILNLLLVAASSGLFFELALILGSSSLGRRRPKREDEELSRPLLVAAGVGTLVFGLSATVWAQASSIEVYSLHLFLIMIVSISFLKGIENFSDAPGTVPRWFLLFAFALGVSFTNHMTSLLLAPAFLYLYFSRNGMARRSFTPLLMSSPFFLLGLSFYVYLPVRSSAGPLLDWGHPAEAQRFLWHVSGKQYRNWIFSGFESAQKQLSYFVDRIPAEFNWTAIVLMVFGLFILLQKRRQLAMFVLLLIAGCLAYSVNYDIHDIDSYFLLAYVGFGLLIVFGIQELVMRVLSNPKIHPSYLLVLVLVPILQWAGNHKGVDESDNFLVADYTQNILAGVDSNAVILTYQWDYFVSASYYEQHVLGNRPDVAVIDKELLRRSWYFLQLERHYPWLIEGSKGRITAFLRELKKFENEEPYDGNVIEALFNGMINDMLLKASETRPVYVGPEIEPQFAPGFERIPEGLLLRLTLPGEKASEREVPTRFRPTGYRSRLTEGLKTQYLRMFTFHALLKRNRGETDAALRWLDKVKEIDPSFPPAVALRQELGATPK